MNVIHTKTIGELIRSKDTPERAHRVEHYLIPYYQRGYRWEDYHVEFLLNDLHDFMQTRNTDNNSYYCLQPIVVANNISKDDKLAQWELIDGQQRLITLNIIFNVIQKTNFELIFDNRIESTHFLENLGKDSLRHDSPDFHFMSVAYETIYTWFKKKADDVAYIDEFYTTCCKWVKVIWYQLESKDENEKIEVFNRLNIGKIALTDAELIKALMLSEVKKGLTPREAILRQSDFSAQWYTIEATLRDDEFWGFLNISNDKYQSGRIELIFDLLAGRKSSKYSTYLWLETELKKGSDVEYSKFWLKVNEIFSILKSWYNNREMYHYVGFLLATNTLGLEALLNASRSEKTKTGFKHYLEGEILKNIAKFDLEGWTYESNRKDIEKTLLLFNILSTVSLIDIPQNRFSFKLYKEISDNGGWSIEHIHAQKSEPIKDEHAIRLWLEDTQATLVDIDTLFFKGEDLVDDGELANKEGEEIDLTDIKGEIYRMLHSPSIDSTEFNDLKDRITRKFDSKSVHELDNLALLGKNHNSSLQNAIFPLKRNKILELERKGAFIPPCTRNVFLKLYNNSSSQPFYWSNKDKMSYFKAIKTVFSEFEMRINNKKLQS